VSSVVTPVLLFRDGVRMDDVTVWMKMNDDSDYNLERTSRTTTTVSRLR
jgi:hypothetical protein